MLPAKYSSIISPMQETFRYRSHTITISGNQITILRDGVDDDKATVMEADPVNSKTLDRLNFAKEWINGVEIPALVQP